MHASLLACMESITMHNSIQHTTCMFSRNNRDNLMHHHMQKRTIMSKLDLQEFVVKITVFSWYFACSMDLCSIPSWSLSIGFCGRGRHTPSIAVSHTLGCTYVYEVQRTNTHPSISLSMYVYEVDINNYSVYRGPKCQGKHKNPKDYIFRNWLTSHALYNAYTGGPLYPGHLGTEKGVQYVPCTCYVHTYVCTCMYYVRICMYECYFLLVKLALNSLT
jgi:hypothetical protein